ncbi:adhesion G protein-coupled receptor F5-like isoform X2 [Ambystoma mexicanum]|uniref:adhesion G protein-coupled receptor F5-like isoform X2 n=1 Tax=Ambystoma mexicanum TaxID=8296 RepID=UPI0037E9AB1B
MRSCWIVIVCPLCFFLNSPSARALEWSLGSSYSSVKNIKNEVMDSLFKSRWRPEREAVTVPQNYIADVEISVPNASLMAPLINFLKERNIAGPFNTSDGVNITSVTVTTACSLNVTTVQCSCEAGYDWPSGTCSASLNCSSSQKRCDCINTFPPEGTHCQLAPTTTSMLTTTYGPTPIKVQISISLTILEIFTVDLWNSSSDKYIRYKGLFETEFYNSYKQLGGFKSVHVTGFRNGSILVDYVIVADPVTPTALEATNQNVISDLKGNFTFPEAPFTSYVHGQTNFTISEDVVFEGDKLVMTCRTVSNSTSVIWTRNNTITMEGSITTNKNGVSESNLAITSTTANDSGVYTCMLNDSSVKYIANKSVSVFSISTRFTDNMDIVCNDSISELYHFCIIGDFSDFACSCTPNGILNINASKILSGNCYTFSLGADASSCPPETSGSKTNYTCMCGTGTSSRVLRTDIITVTFTRPATVTIRGPTAPISETDDLVLNCASSVTNFESMTWQAVKNDGISVLPSDLQFYYYKNNNATLSIPNVARTWNGTYTCIVFQRVTSASSSIAVTIFPLPLDSQITTNIVNGQFACKPPTDIPLQCCTSDKNIALLHFTLQSQGTVLSTSTSNVKCLHYSYSYTSCVPTVIQCIVSNTVKSRTKTIQLNPLKGNSSCKHGLMQGSSGNTFMGMCPSGFTGSITYICLNTGWEKQTNSCISQSLGQLVAESQKLQTQSEIPTFLVNLNSNVTAASNSINNFASVNAIVNVLATLSNVTQSVTSSMMSGFLILVLGCLTDEKIREALLRRFSLTRWASQLTKSTTVSSTRSPPAQKKPKARVFGARGAYNLSFALQSSSSEDTSNTYSVLQ